MLRRLAGRGYRGIIDRLGLNRKQPPEKFLTLEGHPAAQMSAHEAAESQATVNPARNKEFQIYRWSPDHPTRKPYLRSYFVDLSTCGPMVLDALQKIKSEQDSSLTYRRSCREGICGSCAMNIDGVNTVACLKPIDADVGTATTVTPLPHMYVVKDLVVDLTAFYQQYKLIEPWLKTRSEPPGGREHHQTPRDRRRLDGLYECILCACCSTSCPSYWWNPEEFLGPAALLHAYRWISDSRDEFGAERLASIADEDKKMYRCRSIRNCTVTCPKSLDPAKAINNMKTLDLLSRWGLRTSQKKKRGMSNVMDNTKGNLEKCLTIVLTTFKNILIRLDFKFYNVIWTDWNFYAPYLIEVF